MGSLLVDQDLKDSLCCRLVDSHQPAEAVDNPVFLNPNRKVFGSLFLVISQVIAT